MPADTKTKTKKLIPLRVASEMGLCTWCTVTVDQRGDDPEVDWFVNRSEAMADATKAIGDDVSEVYVLRLEAQMVSE